MAMGSHAGAQSYIRSDPAHYPKRIRAARHSPLWRTDPCRIANIALVADLLLLRRGLRSRLSPNDLRPTFPPVLGRVSAFNLASCGLFIHSHFGCEFAGCDIAQR